MRIDVDRLQLGDHHFERVVREQHLVAQRLALGVRGACHVENAFSVALSLLEKLDFERRSEAPRSKQQKTGQPEALPEDQRVGEPATSVAAYEDAHQGNPYWLRRPDDMSFGSALICQNLQCVLAKVHRRPIWKI